MAERPSGAGNVAAQPVGSGELASGTTGAGEDTSQLRDAARAGAWVRSGKLTQAVNGQLAQLTLKTRQGETD